MNPRPLEESVIVGRILGPWGVKGWLQIYSYTDPASRIFEYSPWYIEGHTGPVDVLEHKRSGKRMVVRLPNIDSPELAAKWVDRSIFVAREQLPTLPEGEFYWHDLVGLKVVNREGEALGEVVKMLSTGAHDVMEIKQDDLKDNLLIPFVFGAYVDKVSLADGQIAVQWPSHWLTD